MSSILNFVSFSIKSSLVPENEGGQDYKPNQDNGGPNISQQKTKTKNLTS